MTRWRIGLAFVGVLLVTLVFALLGHPAPAALPAAKVAQVPVGLPRNTQAPPPPALPIAAAVTESTPLVVATLPDANGKLGHALRDITYDKVWAPRQAFTPTALPLDPIRMAFRTFGALPTDLAPTLSRFDPQWGINAISIESMWSWDDANAGIPESTERTRRIRAALEQVIQDTGDVSASHQARLMLLQMDIDQAPPEARSQLVWDKFVAGLRENTPPPMFIVDMYVVDPHISLQDHALFASRYEIHPPDWSDLFLRDVLAKRDAEWTQYWWNHLQISSNRPTASEQWLSHMKANRDQLAGAVGDLIGEARSWQDGLRVAAVSCAKSTDALPFSTEINYQDDRWFRVDNAKPNAFELCIYQSSEPAPTEAQHALLIVQRPGKPAAAILPP